MLNLLEQAEEEFGTEIENHFCAWTFFRVWVSGSDEPKRAEFSQILQKLASDRLYSDDPI